MGAEADVPSYGALAIVLLSAFGFAIAVTFVLLALQARGGRDWRSAGILVLVAVVLLGGAASVLGQVTMAGPSGPDVTCEGGAPSPDLAVLRGVPDDGALTQFQRDCRDRGRFYSAVGGGLILVHLVMVGALGARLRRRSTLSATQRVEW